MINQISQTHPCSGKCQRFNGEQCNTCLIPEPEFGESTSDELGQRPDWLFEKEPTATEAIMEFMRFPGNPQPYCPVCNKREHDLRVLKTLQAENAYVMEGKILLRNAIIGLLLFIVVLLAVALVGAL